MTAATMTTMMMQDPRAGRTAAAAAAVHYAIVQYLSHPRPVVLQLRALHCILQRKINRCATPQGAIEREGATRSQWHKIIASFIPGNDLIAGSAPISGHRSPRRRWNRRGGFRKKYPLYYL